MKKNGMKRVFVAPEKCASDGIKLFLAGGITGCPNWQKDAISYLEDTDLILLNPRRDNFPIHDPNAAFEQILWEYEHLRLADAILFWFPKETLCPIVLYELGAWSMTQKPIFVGVHEDYARKNDVVIQTSLARPEVYVWHDLWTMCRVVKYFVPGGGAGEKGGERRE